MSVDDLERRLRRIEGRNARVEGDKAWEISALRRTTVAALTYLVAAGYLTFLGGASPWLGAAVPTGGYLLSTLALGGVKRWWLRRRGQDGGPHPRNAPSGSD